MCFLTDWGRTYICSIFIIIVFFAVYALCGAHLWGLSTIDYGLLSLFAYFHGEPKSLDLHLRTLFPVI
jgi:hypothetical protein